MSENKQKNLVLINAFGADLQLNVKNCLFFVGEDNRAIAYPVGHLIAIRNISKAYAENKTNIVFINNEKDVVQITSMNISSDNHLLLVCERRNNFSTISVYNLYHLSFNKIAEFEPKRRIISTRFSEYTYASFSKDSNLIACVATDKKKRCYLVVWNIQILKPFENNNYTPMSAYSFEDSILANVCISKITIQNKILCTTGKNHFGIWYLHGTTINQYTNVLDDTNHNFIDHEWMNSKSPSLITVTEEGDFYLLEAKIDTSKGGIIDKNDDDDTEEGSIKIETFIIKQKISNCFNDVSINPSFLKIFSKGVVIGSIQGHLLFIAKTENADAEYKPIRYCSRSKQTEVVGIIINKVEDTMVVAYNSNEIAIINIKNIFEKLQKIDFVLDISFICDGFHSDSITAMDVAYQRPIIVTCSNIDKTVRVWNYLTGHCECCKIILSAKNGNIEKDIDILSLAVHPNGYYIAISDPEMIRLFHICYKELRFYKSDNYESEHTKANCHLLKFSFGGHILAAVSEKEIYLIRAFTRENIKTIENKHKGKINCISFHPKDLFLFSAGEDGLIIAYNLYNYETDIVANTKSNLQSFTLFENPKINIISSGIPSNKKDSKMTRTTFSTQRDEKADRDIVSHKNTTTDNVLCTISALCSFKINNDDICAIGTTNGYISYITVDENNKNESFKNVMNNKIKTHKGKVNFIFYNKNPKLIFTAGEDGNIYVFAVIKKEDNKYEEPYKIYSSLKNSLGEDVIYPLSNIHNNKNSLDSLKTKAEELNKINQQNAKRNTKELKLLIFDMTKETENKINKLNEMFEKIKKEVEDTKTTIKERKENIKNKQKNELNLREVDYKARIEELQNTIHDLKSNEYALKEENLEEIKKMKLNYKLNFETNKKILSEKIVQIEKETKKLKVILNSKTQQEAENFSNYQNEHEADINYQFQSFDSMITELQIEKHVLLEDEKKLTDKKNELIQQKIEIENLIKEEKSKIEDEIIKGQKLIESNKKKVKDIEQMEIKKEDISQNIIKQQKLFSFTSNLKNELYLKNNLLNTEYSKQLKEFDKLKGMNEGIGKENKENYKQLVELEKNFQKSKLLVKEFEDKYYNEKKAKENKIKSINDLLQKIYESAKANDPHIIIKGIRQIYNLYLNSEYKREVDSSKLNVNIRDELIKKINFLQKEIISASQSKNYKEKNKLRALDTKISENSQLIIQMNVMKKENQHLKNSIYSVKKQYQEMYYKTENLKKSLNKEEEHQNDPFIAGILNDNEQNSNDEDITKEKINSKSISDFKVKFNKKKSKKKSEISEDNSEIYKILIAKNKKISQQNYYIALLKQKYENEVDLTIDKNNI